MKDMSGWIARHAGSVPDKPAIIGPDCSLSYRELHTRILQLASLLTNTCALAHGQRVAWLGLNTPDLIALLFACARQGLILIPLNWRLSTRELDAVLDDAGPSLVVIDASCADSADAFRHRPCLRLGFEHIELPTATLGDHAAVPAASGEPHSPVLLVYTSGTTGTPRGVVLTQSALLFNALNSIHMHDLCADDIVLTVLPLFHVGGLNIQTLPALYRGASVILETRFDAARTLDLIDSGLPTLTVQVPATMTALLQHPSWPACRLNRLRAVTTGSTDVPLALIEAWHARSVPVIQVYGATETGPLAIYQRTDDAYTTVGSIGRAGLHSEIRLVDGQGQNVVAGQAGEIQVRGPHVASGYWSSALGAAEAFTDGWFASGDVASEDERGLYWFKDRIKHVIISGGENIYPAELERVLHGHPLLVEAAVAGRADARWGEVPVVVAVARASVPPATILALFDARLARYKHPQDVVFVDALPRTALGKVEVQKLRELVNRSPERFLRHTDVPPFSMGEDHRK